MKRVSFKAPASAYTFPDPERAGEEGLVAVGGDLHPQRILQAYTQGIFPWYSEDQPILWFSPGTRMVLYPENFKRSHTLARLVQTDQFQLRVDHNFEAVIQACARVNRPGQTGTWITPDMIRAYIELHEMGFAHSFETYEGEQLVGGLYGLSLGNAFFGESMFHTANNASKFAFHHLVAFSQTHAFEFIDAQTPTRHLESLGAENLPRRRFLAELDSVLKADSLVGKWTV